MKDKRLLNIALPKGRLGERVLDIFERSGKGIGTLDKDDRKLIFENEAAGVRFFWIKPSDVTVYVERGAADIGIAGSDVIEEHEPDVYELLDLGIGACRMCVATTESNAKNAARSEVITVATKYPETARKYYHSLGYDIDIVKLNGSVEIAPLLGLSDVIVDIVETGVTLRENHLVVTDTIADISARLIANKSSMRFMRDEIMSVLYALREETLKK